MKKSLLLSATFLVATAMGAGSANAASFFWAINQFRTIQNLNGDTGAVVSSFAVPLGSGSAASIAVVGNIGYYTLLGNPTVYKVDMTTQLSLGVAFTVTGASSQNGITTDSSGTLWLADLTHLRGYSTGGTLLADYTFPSATSSYRDGSVVFNGKVVTNRGDQQGPYDLFTLPGANGPLTLTQAAFINPAINGQSQFGSNGIAFNGTNFYTSDEQAHRVSKWDINGNFISFAALDPNSRYENWTFASQDIVAPPVPEPTTWGMMLVGFGIVGGAMRRRQRTSVSFA